MSEQQFPQLSAPFVDPKTGVITAAWMRFLVALWNRTGASTGSTSDDAFIAALLYGDDDTDTKRLSGDVVGIGALDIPTTIQNGVVSYAKMQDVTNNRLLGRAAGAAGSPEELTVGAPLTIGSGAIDFDETANLGNNARVAVSRNSGATVGTRRKLNFIEGTGVTLTITDDSINEEVDVTIDSTGAGGGGYPEALGFSR